MARTPGSSSRRFRASSRAAVISASIALRFSGLSSVTTATCSSCSTLTGTGGLLRHLPEVPAGDLLGEHSEPGVPGVVPEGLALLVLGGVGGLDRYELGQ